MTDGQIQDLINEFKGCKEERLSGLIINEYYLSPFEIIVDVFYYLIQNNKISLQLNDQLVIPTRKAILYGY